jgi:hypothetical protein
MLIDAVSVVMRMSPLQLLCAWVGRQRIVDLDAHQGCDDIDSTHDYAALYCGTLNADGFCRLACHIAICGDCLDSLAMLLARRQFAILRSGRAARPMD